MALIVVVLPMPLRPSSVTTSPRADLERDVEQHLGGAVARLEVGDREHQAASSPR